jgi:hypothetical protein
MDIFAHKSPRRAVQLATLNVIWPAEDLRSAREWQGWEPFLVPSTVVATGLAH